MRTVVIGAGLAGLVAANRLLDAGRTVTVVAKGVGGMVLSQGTIDVLGQLDGRVERPFDAFDALPDGHPYRTLDADHVRGSLRWLRELVDLEGDLETNLLLPTAVGALRPTLLAPPSLAGADARRATSFAVVGARQLKHSPADLLAGNLDRTEVDGRHLRATSSWISFEPRPGEEDPTTVHFANALDDPAALDRFAQQVAAAAGDADVVLVPGVVGRNDRGLWARFRQRVARPVAEVSMQPPNIPGLRLGEALLARARELGARHIQGSFVTGYEADGDRVTGVVVASAGRTRTIACDAVVHAPGGFESGALRVDSHGAIDERVFGLPLTADRVEGLVHRDPVAPQPLFEVGVRADDRMRPVADERPVFDNLHVAGGILAGAQRAHEKSGDGIAVASAVRAADAILEGSL